MYNARVSKLVIGTKLSTKKKKSYLVEVYRNSPIQMSLIHISHIFTNNSTLVGGHKAFSGQLSKA